MRLVLLFAIVFISLGSLAEGALELGNKAYAEKKFEEAIVQFERALIEDPQNTSIYFNLGLTFIRTEELAKARWAFEKAHKMDPFDTEVVDKLNTLDPAGTWTSIYSPLEKLVYGISSLYWAILSIFLSIVLSVAIVYFRIKRLNRSAQLLRLLPLGIFFVLGLIVTDASHGNQITVSHLIVVSASDSSDQKATKSKRSVKAGERLRIKAVQGSTLTACDEQQDCFEFNPSNVKVF